MEEKMSIQWFPGHMAKTKRLIRENLKQVDIVIVITDARIPESSRNPDLAALIGDKPKLYLLNKADMADQAKTNAWIQHYKNQGIAALATDCKSGKGLKNFYPAVREVLKERLERLAAKGMASRPIRMMMVGIPNVGKSSLINRLSGSKRAKVEDRPGVTRGKQWVTIEAGFHLLDMPGVLWPKFEDKEVGEHLAFTGAIKDDVLDIETLAVRLLDILKVEYAALLTARYKVEGVSELDAYELLTAIGAKRGMLLPGGIVDTERAAIMLVDEFRGGKIGHITLESPHREERR